MSRVGIDTVVTMGVAWCGIGVCKCIAWVNSGVMVFRGVREVS
jgi:hypothetical protein